MCFDGCVFDPLVFDAFPCNTALGGRRYRLNWVRALPDERIAPELLIAMADALDEEEEL
jgi:hypothetical protein